MIYIFRINSTNATLVDEYESVDKVITQDTYPAQEEYPNTHAILSYNATDGIHWEYVPYTGAELREKAYETEKLITWGEELLTVDEANDLWVKYDAEGSATAAELTVLIAAAKTDIRERYPD